VYRILDNRATGFAYRGGAFPVYSIEEFLKTETRFDDVVLLITTVAYPEIFEQLNALPKLRDTACFIYQFVRNAPPCYELPPRVNTPQKIPKTIHYIWFGGGDIPRQNRVWMESWGKFCPAYKIVRHDESNYDVSKNRYMYDAYKVKKYAFASDVARLDIIYEEGGIYLDNDVELIGNLDGVLYDDAYFGAVGADRDIVATGLGFGGVKGHGVLKEMFEHYSAVPFILPDGSYNYNNNNTMQSYILRKYGMKDENIPQFMESIGTRVYPTDVFSPCDYMGNPIAFSKNTLSVHHYAGSWIDADETITRNVKTSAYRDFWERHCGGIGGKRI
jgi:hypothetical protein